MTVALPLKPGISFALRIHNTTIMDVIYSSWLHHVALKKASQSHNTHNLFKNSQPSIRIEWINKMRETFHNKRNNERSQKGYIEVGRWGQHKLKGARKGRGGVSQSARVFVRWPFSSVLSVCMYSMY